MCCVLVWAHQMRSLKAASHLGIPGVRHCLAVSSSTGPGHKAILYLKQAEAYVSLIFAKPNLSFLYECSKCQIQAGCSALGVRRSCGFPFLCYCASAEHCVHEISTGWIVKWKHREAIRNNASGFKRDLDHLVDEPADGKCCLV